MQSNASTRSRPGFRSFATVPLAIALWCTTAALTALFIALGWPTLALAIVVMPLLGVTIATTVAAARRPRRDR